MKLFSLLVVLLSVAQFLQAEQYATDVIEKELAGIEELSIAIDQATCNDISVLALLNQRGIRYFILEQYEKALNDFNQVLNSLYEVNKLNEMSFGTALWGRLLCHAYTNQITDSYADLTMVRLYFSKPNCCSECEEASNQYQNTGYSTFKIAQFANPNERLTSEECKERVKGTAKAMRMLCLKIPNQNLAATITFCISELEDLATHCCNKSHWTECLSPIVDAWRYMKNCMDKSMEIAPRALLPGR